VSEAIARLEVMRDEFMNVEGQSSSDEDLFASLKVPFKTPSKFMYLYQHHRRAPLVCT
jgi:hypothetical protein